MGIGARSTCQLSVDGVYASHGARVAGGAGAAHGVDGLADGHTRQGAARRRQRRSGSPGVGGGVVGVGRLHRTIGIGGIEAANHVQHVVHARGAHVVQRTWQRRQALPAVGGRIVGLVGVGRPAVGTYHVDPVVDDRGADLCSLGGHRRGRGPATGFRRGLAGERRGVLDTAQQVAKERSLRVALEGVSAGGVPGATAVVGVVPAPRVIGAHAAAAVRGFVQRHQHVDARQVAGIGPKVVPLVGAGPRGRQLGGRRMGGVLHVQRRRPNVRMTGEIRADQSAVPRPVVAGVAGGMDADKAVARFDEALEGGSLIVVEDVARRRQEHHGAVRGQPAIGEHARVFRRVDAEPVLRTEALNGGDACRNGVVTEGGRLAEHQDARAFTSSARARGAGESPTATRPSSVTSTSSFGSLTSHTPLPPTARPEDFAPSQPDSIAPSPLRP